MTDLRTAAQQALDAKQVPLRELLASVPADARLLIDDADGKGTRSIPVGRLCQEAAAALAEPKQDGCDHCNHPMYCAIKCKVCGRVTEPVQEPDPWGAGYEAGYAAGMEERQAEPVQKPVQEPVGEVVAIDFSEESGPEAIVTLHQDVELGTMLYTAPPQRKPLSEEEITQCFADAGAIVKGHLWVKVIRNVERAHGITS